MGVADVDALIALFRRRLHLDATAAFRVRGREIAARFYTSIFRAGRRFDLVPTRANVQPAFGAYLHSPDEVSHGVGLYVLTVDAEGIRAMTRFESRVLPSFGLPPQLPSR